MDEQTIWSLIGQALTIESIHPYLDSMYNSSLGFNYYRFAYVLAQAMRPDNIVELGTQYARCTAHFAAGASNARVVTVDHIDCRKQKLFEHNVRKWYPNIELVVADSRDPEVVNMFEDESIGICFADSLHTYEHVMDEIDAWTPKMQKGGVWLIDDLREMPYLLTLLPFEVKGTIMGMHTNVGDWPDQRFSYAIVT